MLVKKSLPSIRLWSPCGVWSITLVANVVVTFLFNAGKGESRGLESKVLFYDKA